MCLNNTCLQNLEGKFPGEEMLEPELCSSRVLSPYRDESGDEELSVLPRHTKVIVTGNNRTKSVLVGLQGVVKKAVGLGGWHWLVLKNGDEVKLQRNAIKVVGPPTGDEIDEDDDFDNSSSSSDQFSSGTESQKWKKPRVEPPRPMMVQSKLPNAGPKNGVFRFLQPNNRTPQPKVNLEKLGKDSLCRYWKRHNLGKINCNPTKEQMLNAIQRHFALQQVNEEQVVREFIRSAKRLRRRG